MALVVLELSGRGGGGAGGWPYGYPYTEEATSAPGHSSGALCDPFKWSGSDQAQSCVWYILPAAREP